MVAKFVWQAKSIYWNTILVLFAKCHYTIYVLWPDNYASVHNTVFTYSIDSILKHSQHNHWVNTIVLLAFGIWLNFIVFTVVKPHTLHMLHRIINFYCASSSMLENHLRLTTIRNESLRKAFHSLTVIIIKILLKIFGEAGGSFQTQGCLGAEFGVYMNTHFHS